MAWIEQAKKGSRKSQMFEVLRAGGWLSIVFAHRDTTYWSMLVDACKATGFQYSNTVVQPVGVVWSMHKKKNPLRVLSGELVLNFKKPRTAVRKPQAQTPIDVVRACCEKAILQAVGATTEELHHAVVPELLETGLLDQFSKSHGDITPVLKHMFDFENGRWYLRIEQTLLAAASDKEIARYYTVRFLQGCHNVGRNPTEEEVLGNMLELKPNGRLFGFDKKTVQSALYRCAYADDGIHWRLGTRKQRQLALSV